MQLSLPPVLAQLLHAVDLDLEVDAPPMRGPLVGASLSATTTPHSLIPMGSRGIGGITGFILGSTSRGVVDYYKKPVLIIKTS